MNRIYVFLGLLFLANGQQVFAQAKFTINGYVKDSLSGESVIGATIAVNGRSVTSNQYGFYSITIDSGRYNLTSSHVSFQTFAQAVELTRNLQFNIYLLPKSAALNEVVVFSRRRM
jgi:hypothetical protein